uniref:Uncharacterized protein n=1 Tax=Marseillevirus sp. TaxID=2809551 RepID=A0AA96ESL1_9VIRU|nr:hypothetical protein MarFTMF_515 [Marseillevirus sp.]
MFRKLKNYERKFLYFLSTRMQNIDVVFAGEPFPKGIAFRRDCYAYGADWDGDHPNDFQEPSPRTFCNAKSGSSHQQGKDTRISERALGKRTNSVRAVISGEIVLLPVESESNETSPDEFESWKQQKIVEERIRQQKERSLREEMKRRK